jgi:hypothetical protein
MVSNDQPEAREGLAGRLGVAERFVVPLKPGNSGGGKGPQFKTGAIRREGPWRLGNLSTPINGQNCRRRCTRTREFLSESRMREICTSGSMSGMWKRSQRKRRQQICSTKSHRATSRLSQSRRFITCEPLPVCLNQRTFSAPAGMSQRCHKLTCREYGQINMSDTRKTPYSLAR